ncbi:MAG: DNA primase [Caldiserica bacterium]|nr:DNA primase [Caldisericota bacterium]
MSALEEIREKVDIVELISRYVALKPSGKGYKGRCPFHPDDTPSFYVSPEKKLWHCFGCGAGGDAIGFLMRIERLSFREALERLAAELGVELRASGERQRLLKVNAAAAAFFHEMLGAPEGRAAQEYLLSRGMGPETWDRYGLGYAPSSGDALLSALSRFGLADLERLGLIVRGDRGYRDRFVDRVIFPIRDELGRPVAFAGRSLSGAEPKYLNSPNTPLFTKGTLLYGLDLAKEAIRSSGRAVLVEGYTDVISLQVAGIREAVCSMGTALTEAQARRLARYAREVVLAYDADAAGEASALRGIGILLDAGLEVRVAPLPEGEDPDSLVRSRGVAALHAAIAEAVEFHDFLLELLPRRFDLSSLRGKEEALELVRSLWEHVKNPLLRREWARRLALLLDLPEEETWKALGGKLSWKGVAEGEEGFGPEEVVLKFMFAGKLGADKLSQLAPEDFSPEYRRIVCLWLERCGEGKAEPHSISSELDLEEQARLSRILLWDINFSDEGRALEEAWQKFFVIPRLERRIRALREEMERAEKAGEKEQLEELVREYVDLCRSRAKVLKGEHGG